MNKNKVTPVEGNYYWIFDRRRLITVIGLLAEDDCLYLFDENPDRHDPADFDFIERIPYSGL